MKRITLFVLSLFLISGKLFSQNDIEKFLKEHQLITDQQLNKYHEKQQTDDSYVKAMIKLMKGDKETRAYALKMEKEYKDEQAKKKTKRDTLAILQDILQVSCIGKDITDKTEDTSLYRKLSEFTLRLAEEHFITKSDAEKTNSAAATSSWFFDSCSVISRAIEYRNLARITTSSKLLGLMDTLRMLKILSDVNYQKLTSEPMPDSVSKITYILSLCEKIFISNKSPFIKNEEDFFSRIDSLSRLSKLPISEIKLDFIVLNRDSSDFRAIPVIKAMYNNRQFIHECYEVSTTQKSFDPYTLAGHDFYQIFNKILEYKNSDRRVYEIKEKNPMQWSQGFILLTEKQRNALFHNEQVELSYYDYKKAFTSQQITRAIGIYSKSGLLKNIPQKSIDSIIADAGQNPVFRYNELISRFPFSVTINDRIPLTVSQADSLIRKMAAISNYEFNPTNIKIEKNVNGKWILFFEEHGDSHRHEFYSFINWEGIWGLIHNVIFSNLNRKAQYEVLRFGQYRESYIYVTHEQMKMLRSANVIDDY